MALVANGTAGVSVFNVANILAPVRIAQVSITGLANVVALDGMQAAIGGAYLSLLDVSVPAMPSLIRQSLLGGNVLGLTASGGIAYAGLDNGQIVAVDIATGVEVDRLSASNQPIQDVCFAGDILYARTAGQVLAIEFQPQGMVLDSTVTVTAQSSSRPRLFAGGALAYASSDTGYAVLSLADPIHPRVVQNISTTQRGWRQLVPTGSGQGLGILSVNPGAKADVSLYNLGANGQGSQFLTTFVTPGQAQAVSIFDGLAYVADGDAGLTIVNYLAYDTKKVPPTISISTDFATTGGALQAEEGKTGLVTAVVNDDVQVRDVEFYVDGQLVVTDGNFPFEHRFTTPLLAAGKTSFTLSAKAFDTGGNSTMSNTLTVNLVKDATPPRVVKFLPPTGSFTGSLRNVSATFSEPIDPATLDASSFALIGAGPDGVFGTTDDFVPAGSVITYHDANNTVFVSFGQDLIPSLYRLVVSAPVADLAGNVIAAPVQTQFRVFSFKDSDGDGIPDDVEPLLGLDPHNPDTDGNGVRDGDEDYDHDHLTNAQEIALGLDPRNPYSNGTTVLDGDADPDHDGLSNRREALAGTDPHNSDTDGDGWNDEAEITGGSNPLDPKSRPIGFVTSLPPTTVVRLGDLTTGLLTRASLIAQPPVFLARTSSDPNSPNGGQGSASFVATPTVFTARPQSDATGANGNTGTASLIANPMVIVSRYDPATGANHWLSGSILAQPVINITSSTSTPDGSGAATFIATPISNVEIQNP